MDYRIIFLPDFDKEIINIIQTANRPVTVTEIMDTVYGSNPQYTYDYHNKRATIHRHLKSLSDRGILKKVQVHEKNFVKDYASFEFLPEIEE